MRLHITGYLARRQSAATKSTSAPSGPSTRKVRNVPHHGAKAG
jgi:hypothetical protein